MRIVYPLLLALALPSLTLGSVPLTAAEGDTSNRAPDYSRPGGGLSLAAITTAVTAFQVAKAAEGTPNVVKSASFFFQPSFGNYRAVVDEPLSTFPSVGNSFGVLSTGNAAWIKDPNTSGSTSADNGGAPVNGNSAYDAVTLEIDLGMSPLITVNCLSLEYRFFSEEYPEYIGSIYNDAFIAEVGATTWTASDGIISSPDNFAISEAGDLISINGVGSGGDMSAAAATGTTYDGATAHYYAETPLPPPMPGLDGLNHYFLYLTIFDQSDAVFDSTVFLDNIQLFTKPTCARGPSTIVHP